MRRSTGAGKPSGSSRVSRRRGGPGTGGSAVHWDAPASCLGRLDEAGRLGRCAVEAASGRTDFLPDALQLLGDVATHPDGLDADRVATYYSKALALADSRGMRPLVAHCHLGLAKLHRATGDGPTAREHLSTAAAMYREMDMRFWLDEAEAAMRDQV